VARRSERQRAAPRIGIATGGVGFDLARPLPPLIWLRRRCAF
jgi:hypothetical protein